jgi:predicted anti-sigma-YlaC factor YlaD
MKIQLDCQEVSRLISHGLDETLPAPDRARMRLHFVICQTCRDVNEQMQFLRNAMRQIDKEGPPGE